MLTVLVLAAGLQLEVQPPLQKALPPPPVVAHHVALLRDWVRAVMRHEPGETDSAALTVANFSFDDLQYLWVDVRALIAVVKDIRTNVFYVRAAGQSTAPVKDIHTNQSLARAAGQSTPLVKVFTTPEDLATLRKLSLEVKRVGVSEFYRRAAVIHSDAIMRAQSEPMTGPLTGTFYGPQRTMVTTEDGRQTGVHGGFIHWEFGRMLLDLVEGASGDDMVRAWYRATMAYKLDVEELETEHFDRGRELFPDDAEILFLSGALHEAFSDPRIQVARETMKLPFGIKLAVGGEREELGRADEFFERATRSDPAHVEARVRHGRVLSRLGRPKEAVEELRRALAITRDRELTYLAQLFLGGAEEALGRLDAARSAYQLAAELYPRAQAPVFALSQLQHRTGDRRAAHAALKDVLRPDYVPDPDNDPWWRYHMSAGRFVDERTAALYRSVPPFR